MAFTGAGRLGYLRHLLRSRDLPIGELLAAHLHAAAPAHEAAGNLAWKPAVMQELIALLRDDYSTLTAVLGALGEIVE